MPIGYYVTALNDSRRALLLGPLDTHEAALARVDEVNAWASARITGAHFWAFGTARIENADGLPQGRLNERLADTPDPSPSTDPRQR